MAWLAVVARAALGCQPVAVPYAWQRGVATSCHPNSPSRPPCAFAPSQPHPPHLHESPCQLPALGTLVPLPTLASYCGPGCGLAASPPLGLFVTSSALQNNLTVWTLPAPGLAPLGPGAPAVLASPVTVCTLGGDGSVAPLQFHFYDGQASGSLAFTTPTTSSTSGGPASGHPLLLVTDAGHDAVHLVDVVERTHVGYLAVPGSILGPRGVAASKGAPLVAVSARQGRRGGEGPSPHVVVLYQGSGTVWEVIRVIGGGFGGPGPADGQMSSPCGLRLSGDGSVICVADWGNRRASVFRAGDGSFVRHIATGLRGPMDVEEVEGGWLVACWSSHSVELVGEEVCRGSGGGADAATIGAVADGSSGSGGGGVLGKVSLHRRGSGWGPLELSYPTALALVPGLGLIVREFGNARFKVGRMHPDCTRPARKPCVNGPQLGRAPALHTLPSKNHLPCDRRWHWAIHKCIHVHRGTERGLPMAGATFSSHLCLACLALQVFVVPDWVAMATMSVLRIAWMAAVARGAMARPGFGRAP